MPFPLIPLIGAGISGLAGLFGNRKQQTPSEQTNKSTTIGSNNSSGTNYFANNNNFSPLQQSLIDTMGAGALDRYNKGPGDVSSIIAQNLSNVNRNADRGKENVRDIIARRGLSFSPAAGITEVMNENNRISQANSVVNSQPMLERQINDENLKNLISVFSAIPTNTSGINNFSTSGNSNTTTDQKGTGLVTQPGNMTAGALSGIGSALFTPIDSSGRTILDLLFGGGGADMGNT